MCVHVFAATGLILSSLLPQMIKYFDGETEELTVEEVVKYQVPLR